MELSRKYIWYNPEYDWIVLQTIMEDCIIAFEWDFGDFQEAIEIFGLEEFCRYRDPISETAWMPVGEL